MAKLLEILSLGIQNSKNVMFWLIFRKFSKCPRKAYMLHVTKGFLVFEPQFMLVCYLNVVYKVADLPYDRNVFPPDLHSTEGRILGRRIARIGSSRVTDCFHETVKIQPQQIQGSHQCFSF